MEIEIFICRFTFFRLINEIRNLYEQFNGAKMIPKKVPRLDF